VAAVGLPPELLAALGAVHFQVADLPGRTLGVTYRDAGTVVIDADAAGHGWFVDPTPGSDEEFTGGRGDGLDGSRPAPRPGRRWTCSRWCCTSWATCSAGRISTRGPMPTT
jgi:hypothetical protein